MRDISPWRQPRPPELANAPSHPNSEVEYVLQSADEEPHFRDYWRMLLHRRYLVVLVFLAVFAFGTFITVKEPKLYTATASIKIETRTILPIGYPDMTGGSPDFYETQVALLRSRALAARVISSLNLQSNPHFVSLPRPLDRIRNAIIGPVESSLVRFIEFVSPPPSQEAAPAPAPAQPITPAVPPEMRSASTGQPSSTPKVRPYLIGRYLSFLTVEPVPKTYLVRVSFSTHHPQLSQELANAHAVAFIRMNLETRFELTSEAREFLEKKLSEVTAKVERSEEAFNRFLQTHGVVSLEGHENIVASRMVQLNSRLTEARARRIELESLQQIVKNRNTQYLTEIMNNSSIQQLKAGVATLQTEATRLSTIYKRDHPRIKELDQQIREARQRLNLEVANIVRGVETDYMAARAREEALQVEAERLHQAALDLKGLGVQYTLLQGELQANRAVYENILKQLNETTLSTGSPLSNIQVADVAEVPGGPSFPQTSRNLFMASALGLFFGVGLALLLEHLNSTIRTPADVWRAVGLPTLAVVPHLSPLRRRMFGYGRLGSRSSPRLPTAFGGEAHQAFSRGLIAAHHPFSINAESYRSARTSLLLSQGEQPLQVVLIVSANPGDGKTVTTLNLGITLAQSGRKVVVVDADLRQGNGHVLLGLREEHGLSNLLTDKLPLEECMQATAIEKLTFLSRGTVPHNPTELLESSQMREILRGLRERFDIVLIDSPPGIAISDAVILATQCDGVLLVLRAQQTSTEAARRLVEGLDIAGARILGTVLNGIDIRNPHYADYRQYYKSYYSATNRQRKNRG